MNCGFQPFSLQIPPVSFCRVIQLFLLPTHTSKPLYEFSEDGPKLLGVSVLRQPHQTGGGSGLPGFTQHLLHKDTYLQQIPL